MENKSETKLSADQAALLGSVSQVDSAMEPGPVDAQGNPIQPADAGNAGEENAAMLQLLVGMAAPAMPFLADIYTSEVCGRIGAAFAAVEEKYGWDVKSKLGCEVVLALVTIPPTLTAVMVGRQYFANERAKLEAKATQQEDGSGAGN